VEATEVEEGQCWTDTLHSPRVAESISQQWALSSGQSRRGSLRMQHDGRRGSVPQISKPSLVARSLLVKVMIEPG
jgi:hypothetical protein